MTTADLVVATPCPPQAVVVSAGLLAGIDHLVLELTELPEIRDQPTLDAVHSVVVRAKQLQNQIEAERQRIKRPFLDVGRQLDAAAKPVTLRLQAIIDEGKSQQETFLIEQERLRVAAEAERARQAALAAAATTGPRLTPALAPAALAPAPVQASLMTRRRVEVIDASLLPREYLTPDMSKITAHALMGLGIPGVAVYEEKQVVAR